MGSTNVFCMVSSTLSEASIDPSGRLVLSAISSTGSSPAPSEFSASSPPRDSGLGRSSPSISALKPAFAGVTSEIRACVAWERAEAIKAGWLISPSVYSRVSSSTMSKRSSPARVGPSRRGRFRSGANSLAAVVWRSDSNIAFSGASASGRFVSVLMNGRLKTGAGSGSCIGGSTLNRSISSLISITTSLGPSSGLEGFRLAEPTLPVLRSRNTTTKRST